MLQLNPGDDQNRGGVRKASTDVFPGSDIIPVLAAAWIVLGTFARRRLRLLSIHQIQVQETGHETYRGKSGPRGIGRSSRSNAIFVAACNPYK